jgi:hypothetical protein
VPDGRTARPAKPRAHCRCESRVRPAESGSKLSENDSASSVTQLDPSEVPSEAMSSDGPNTLSRVTVAMMQRVPVKYELGGWVAIGIENATVPSLVAVPLLIVTRPPPRYTRGSPERAGGGNTGPQTSPPLCAI